MSSLRPTNPDPLLEPLAGYLRQYEYICDDTEKLVAGLSDHQFNWRTAPGTWSIAECLGHLTLSGNQSLPTFDRLITEARARNLQSAGPYRRPLLGNWMIAMLEPPYRMKSKSFKNMIPPPDQRLADVLPAFLELQEQFRDRIFQCNGLDLGAVSAQTLIKVRLTLGQWFEMTAAHERRHLWQARNVRNHPQFPSI